MMKNGMRLGTLHSLLKEARELFIWKGGEFLRRLPQKPACASHQNGTDVLLCCFRYLIVPARWSLRTVASLMVVITQRHRAQDKRAWESIQHRAHFHLHSLLSVKPRLMLS